MILEKLKNNCLKGRHDFIEVSYKEIGYDVEEVVRWCPTCGGIVVDIETDNRLMGRRMNFKTPSAIKLIVLNQARGKAEIFEEY